ncbi:MAG: hypothetical protein A2283_20560 [Lentisphaerae bacterium RIFOXYA12_FULL_48_11]|nr:MAG: hypothetical protein A2283_20560 [Lentisphaerae bacterium RIFOXYA12_FULL_48_11]
MKQLVLLLGTMLVPVMLAACPPKELRGMERSHCTVAVKLVSAERITDAGGFPEGLSFHANVLYGSF